VRAAGGEGIAVSTNLARRDEVVAMIARTVEHFGGVDILISNAVASERAL
jgi:NAD(P)-dependent dehydrogenase (short-subunit alcohol dehydrogenase family)